MPTVERKKAVLSREIHICLFSFANPQGEDVEARGRGLVGVAVRGQARQRPRQRCSHQGCPPIESCPIISIHCLDEMLSLKWSDVFNTMSKWSTSQRT